MFCRQQSAYLGAGNQLAFCLEQLQSRYLLHLGCRPHILELVAGSAYAEMMGAYSGPQILLFKRFQTHHAEAFNKAQFQDSF